MTIFKSYYFLLGNKMFQISLAIRQFDKSYMRRHFFLCFNFSVLENLRATCKILRVRKPACTDCTRVAEHFVRPLFLSRRVVQMMNSRKELVILNRNLCFINYIFARKIIEVHLTILVQFFASSITIICGSRD